MRRGYKIEFSEDSNQVCIIPNAFIYISDFDRIVNGFLKEGYKYWLPADHRGGFIFAKEIKET